MGSAARSRPFRYEEVDAAPAKTVPVAGVRPRPTGVEWRNSDGPVERVSDEVDLIVRHMPIERESEQPRGDSFGDW